MYVRTRADSCPMSYHSRSAFSQPWSRSLAYFGQRLAIVLPNLAGFGKVRTDTTDVFRDPRKARGVSKTYRDIHIFLCARAHSVRASAPASVHGRLWSILSDVVRARPGFEFAKCCRHIEPLPGGVTVCELGGGIVTIWAKLGRHRGDLSETSLSFVPRSVCDGPPLANSHTSYPMKRLGITPRFGVGGGDEIPHRSFSNTSLRPAVLLEQWFGNVRTSAAEFGQIWQGLRYTWAE